MKAMTPVTPMTPVTTTPYTTRTPAPLSSPVPSAAAVTIAPTDDAPTHPGPSPSSVLGALFHHADSRPDSPALRPFDSTGHAGAVWTYARLAASVHARAQTLAHLFPTDACIILQSSNSPDFVSWFLATLLAGLRVLPLHPLSTLHELHKAARRSGARGLIAAEPEARGSNPAPDNETSPDLLYIPLTSHDLPADHATADRTTSSPLSASTNLLPSIPRRATGSILLHSSGSTSTPKLVRRTESSLDADARGVATAARLTPLDRVAAVVPLSHSYGVDLLVATILAGAALDVFDRFDPAVMQAHLTHGGLTVFPGVPSMFDALARDSSAPRPRDLCLAFSAGSPLPRRIAGVIHQSWNLPLGQLYGATELGSVTLDTPDHPGFDPASVGLPFTSVSIRAVDPARPDRPLPPGVEGELAVMAPSMFAEYLGDPAPLVDGHFLTGDLGRVAPSGHIYITGRLKHLIDVGGLKVNPLEIEEVIGQHPAIAECAVVPLDCSDTVARLRLLFIPRPDAAVSASELRSFCRARLAPYKVPRVFDPVASLPRTPGGKLLRHLIPHA